MGEKGRTPASRESPPPPPPASAPPPPFHSVAQHGWSAAEVSRPPPAAPGSCARAPRLPRRLSSALQKPSGPAVASRQHVGHPGRELSAGGCQVRTVAAVAGGLRADGAARTCSGPGRGPRDGPAGELAAVETEAAGPCRPGACGRRSLGDPRRAHAVGVCRWPAAAWRQVPREP